MTETAEGLTAGSHRPIDDRKILEGIDRKLASVVEPRHRKILEVFREHATAEVDRDLDRVMATLVPDPAYHIYRFGLEVEVRSGWETIHEMYRTIFRDRPQGHERAWHRIIVDDFGVFADGVIRMLVTGEQLESFTGHRPTTTGGRYIVSMRSAVIFPFQGYLIAGEDVYGLSGRVEEASWLNRVE